MRISMRTILCSCRFSADPGIALRVTERLVLRFKTSKVSVMTVPEGSVVLVTLCARSVSVRLPSQGR